MNYWTRLLGLFILSLVVGLLLAVPVILAEVGDAGASSEVEVWEPCSDADTGGDGVEVVAFDATLGHEEDVLTYVSEDLEVASGVPNTYLGNTGVTGLAMNTTYEGFANTEHLTL